MKSRLLTVAEQSGLEQARRRGRTGPPVDSVMEFR
jgi:hypothetical protein